MTHEVDMNRELLYGMLVEFDRADAIVAAAHFAHAAGYRKMNAYTPFPVEGLSEALGQQAGRLPLLVLCGGISGGVLAYCMLYYASVISYPLNVGGRPLHSWPSFIPITFEMTVLGAALTCFLGMLALNGLPHPNHPLFEVPTFSLASRDRFFLCIQAQDPMFDHVATRHFLETLSPHIHEVPA